MLFYHHRVATHSSEDAPPTESVDSHYVVLWCVWVDLEPWTSEKLLLWSHQAVFLLEGLKILKFDYAGLDVPRGSCDCTIMTATRQPRVAELLKCLANLHNTSQPLLSHDLLHHFLFFSAPIQEFPFSPPHTLTLQNKCIFPPSNPS